MSEIATKWSVLLEHAVTGADTDESGMVRDDVVERWIDGARDAYLERCVALEQLRASRGLELRCRWAGLPPGSLLGRPASVVVSASAPEVRPSSFTIMVRLRPVASDVERPINVACLVRLADGASDEACELGTDVRDELIALERAAAHFN